jgi:branched-chain amino acid transport system permease protein
MQQLVNGVTLGAILALIALGYSLVYGIIGTIQFAYGGIYAIGAFLGIILIALLNGIGPLPLVLTLGLVTLLAAAITGLWGAAIERVIYRPLRGAGTLTPLIAAIGLTLVLENLLRLTQGASYKWLPALLFGRFVIFSAGGFSVMIGGTQLVIFAATVILAVSLSGLMAHTSLGRAYRACADDRGMAALLGVDVDRVILATFAGGAMLAAIAGLIQTLYYGEADPSMGYLIGFKALTAALLGGFGSLPGAVLGGFAIGLIEVYWTAYFGASYKDLVIFVVLCAVLVYRPAGFLGIPEGEPGPQLRGRPLNRSGS